MSIATGALAVLAVAIIVLIHIMTTPPSWGLVPPTGWSVQNQANTSVNGLHGADVSTVMSPDKKVSVECDISQFETDQGLSAGAWNDYG